MAYMRMTWTLIGMSCCYVAFVFPIYLLNILNTSYPTVNVYCFILYFFQYSIDFILYAARSEHYRCQENLKETSVLGMPM